MTPSNVDGPTVPLPRADARRRAVHDVRTSRPAASTSTRARLAGVDAARAVALAGMALIPVLGETGRLQLVFGALLALGLALSG